MVGALMIVQASFVRYPRAATNSSPEPVAELWSPAMLESLSLEQKIAQMFAANGIGGFHDANDPEYRRLVKLVEDFQVGCLVLFQSEPLSQVALVNDLQARSNVPLLVAQDMEWGPGMRVRDATTFPRTMAIGATRNPDYAYAAGFVTATEARALGTHQVYAPVADINSNPDNPIINIRSYGERPDLVSEMVVSFVRGLQDGGTIATVKHFPGHGDTSTDSHADLPILRLDRSRLDKVELRPFRSAIDAGAKSIMTGHLAFPTLEPDTRIPATLSPQVTQALLRDEFGFQGLIVTDAMNMAGVTKNFNVGESAVRAIEAGADIILMSEDVYKAREAIVSAVRSGRLSEARIDASVMRILNAKESMGLNRNRLIEVRDAANHVATPDHRMVSETIARESLTLLRNKGIIPVDTRRYSRILTVVLNEDPNPSLANTFTRQVRETARQATQTVRVIQRGDRTAEYDRVLTEVNDFDIVIIPVIVNVRAWGGSIKLRPNQKRFIDAVSRKKPVVLLSLGNPYIIRDLDIPPTAYIAAYGVSEASQKTAAQAIFGQSPFHGTLPVTIPKMYPFGFGLSLEQTSQRVGFPEEVGMSTARLDAIDSLIHASIGDHAFPAAAVAIGRAGVVTKMRGYGHFTYESGTTVTEKTQFDLASMTKVIVTTTAIMQLYESGAIKLDDPVARYLPAFGANGKQDVTIRQLLQHRGGLIPYRRYHMNGYSTRQSVIDAIMTDSLVYEPGTETRYSDLGMITLGLLVERVSGLSLADYADRRILRPLGMINSGFKPVGAGGDPLAVPTEVDSTFRMKLIQGEVHDETAYLLGGASGHAGLFSTAEDLARFADMMLHEGMIDGKRFLKASTIKLFTMRSDDISARDRALGWDLKSPDGYSSAGKYFGPNSFGHTGFTGTSIWIDPDAKLFAILLTNRVYPTRDNRSIVTIRPQFADLAFAAIEGAAEPKLPLPPH